MIDLPFVDYQLPEKPDGQLIAIIGEAPGADEVRQGKPFVGRSGQLLDKNLAAAGIARASCLVANVFRYQPPQNKAAHFFLSKRAAAAAGEAISPEWGAFAGRYCRTVFAGEIAHLQKTLLKFRPTVILTLGGTSLWALTGMEGITALRGQPQPCRLLPETDVIPTYHPSYILRGNWTAEPAFLADLVKAAGMAAIPVKKSA